MSLNKFPKAQTLIEALTNYDTTIVTSDGIGALHRAWPKESSLSELAGMVLGDNEIWDKSESYMIDLCEPTSIYDRLTVWVYRDGFDGDKTFITQQIRQMNALYDFLDTNDTMYKVLGLCLAIGNIMNGGTPKGRSDGFDVSVMAKMGQTKDNSNRSMLQFIIAELMETDDEFHA